MPQVPSPSSTRLHAALVPAKRPLAPDAAPRCAARPPPHPPAYTFAPQDQRSSKLHHELDCLEHELERVQHDNNLLGQQLKKAKSLLHDVAAMPHGLNSELPDLWRQEQRDNGRIAVISTDARGCTHETVFNGAWALPDQPGALQAVRPPSPRSPCGSRL